MRLRGIDLSLRRLLIVGILLIVWNLLIVQAAGATAACDLPALARPTALPAATLAALTGLARLPGLTAALAGLAFLRLLTIGILRILALRQLRITLLRIALLRIARLSAALTRLTAPLPGLTATLARLTGPRLRAALPTARLIAPRLRAALPTARLITPRLATLTLRHLSLHGLLFIGLLALRIVRIRLLLIRLLAILRLTTSSLPPARLTAAGLSARLTALTSARLIAATIRLLPALSSAGLLTACLTLTGLLAIRILPVGILPRRLLLAGLLTVLRLTIPPRARLTAALTRLLSIRLLAAPLSGLLAPALARLLTATLPGLLCIRLRAAGLLTATLSAGLLSVGLLAGLFAFALLPRLLTTTGLLTGLLPAALSGLLQLPFTRLRVGLLTTGLLTTGLLSALPAARLLVLAFTRLPLLTGLAVLWVRLLAIGLLQKLPFVGRAVASAGLRQLLRIFTGPRRGLPIRQGRARRGALPVDFILQLLDRAIEFRAGPPHGFGFITQHAGRRLFNALAQARDALARVGLGLPGFLVQAALQQIAAGIEGLAGFGLAGLPDRVIQLPRQHRL